MSLAASESLDVSKADRLTDAALIATLYVVPFAFAGRTAWGYLIFVLMAVAVGLCWCVSQMLRQRRWQPNGIEPLFALGAGLIVLQLLAIPYSVQSLLSPNQSGLLPAWAAKSAFGNWTTMSYGPSATTQSLAGFLAGGMLLLVAIQHLRTTDCAMRFLKHMAGCAIVMAGFALAQLVFSNGRFFWVFELPGTTTSTSAQGSFPNPNHLSAFLVLGLGCAVAWLLDLNSAKREPREKTNGWQRNRTPFDWRLPASLIGIGVIIAAVIATKSRGGLMDLAIFGVVAIPLLLRRKLVPEFALLATLLVAAVGGAVLFQKTNMAREIEGGSIDARLRIWNVSIAVANRHPFVGTGLGTHRMAHGIELDAPHLHREYRHAESSVFQTLSETGYAGLILAGLAVCLMLRWAWIGVRKQTEPRGSAAAICIFAALAAFAVHGIADVLWHVPACMVFVSLLAAAAFRLSRDEDSHQSTPKPLPVRPIAGGAICLFVLSIALGSLKQTAFAESHLQAFSRSELAEEAARTKAPLSLRERTAYRIQQVKHLAKAVRVNPANPVARFFLAQRLIELVGLRQSARDGVAIDEIKQILASTELKPTQAKAWLKKVLRGNEKLLRLAAKHARRVVNESPLNGEAYVLLARLSFLHQIADEDLLLEQAEIARPFHPQTLYGIGLAHWESDREDDALRAWQKASARDERAEQNALARLSRKLPAKRILEQMTPSYKGLLLLRDRYRKAETDDALRLVQRSLLASAIEEAKATNGKKSVAAWITAAETAEELERMSDAQKIFKRAQTQHAGNVVLITGHAALLLRQRDWSAAAKLIHRGLRYSPGDKRLQLLQKKLAQYRRGSIARSPEDANANRQ